MDLSLGGKPSSASSRILYDIPCKVCQDHSSGKHYGIFACDGCAGFFKRSIRRNRQYVCKAKESGGCLVDKTHRNQCRACRLSRCVQAGMNKDAVQHERGPRNSTLRRQMSLLYGDCSSSSTGSPPRLPLPPPAAASPESGRRPREGGESSERDASGSPPAGPPRLAPPEPSLAIAPSYLPALKPGRDDFLLPLMGSPESLCESAARILFGNVDWSKHLPAFSSLPYRDQVVLLQESWRELFVLSLAQTLLPVEVEPLLTLAGASHQSAELMLPLLKEIGQLREVVARLRSLRVDPTEYMCLKWIVLFKTEFPRSSTGMRELQQLPAVSLLQDQAQLTLTRYITAAYPSQPIRLAKLLMIAATVRDVPASLIEQLFFKRTIKDIPIERLITDMFKQNDV